MREKQARAAEEWNLTLAATSADEPLPVLKVLGSAVTAQGGWVLRQGGVSDRCADMDFEFPRSRGMEVYGLLLAAGLVLSREAHEQLMGLCHCTGHVGAREREAVARVHLSVYGREGSEAFFGTAFSDVEEAA